LELAVQADFLIASKVVSIHSPKVMRRADQMGEEAALVEEEKLGSGSRITSVLSDPTAARRGSPWTYHVIRITLINNSLTHIRHNR
jgi:hypothetical protein